MVCKLLAHVPVKKHKAVPLSYLEHCMTLTARHTLLSLLAADVSWEIGNDVEDVGNSPGVSNVSCTLTEHSVEPPIVGDAALAKYSSGTSVVTWLPTCDSNSGKFIDVSTLVVAGSIEEETHLSHCSPVTVKHDDCHATFEVYLEIVCDSEESVRLSDHDGGVGTHE